MIITRDNLPKTYQPFKELMLCSNRIIGGSYIVSIGNVIPILVGQGSKPKVWLQAVTDPRKRRFALLVDASVSRDPGIKITEDAQGVLQISTGGTILLRLEAKQAGLAVIDRIDLRPLGINLVGDSLKLEAGGPKGVKLTGNTFEGVKTVIAFRE